MDNENGVSALVDDTTQELVKMSELVKEGVKIHKEYEANFNSFRKNHKIVDFLRCKWKKKQGVKEC